MKKKIGKLFLLILLVITVTGCTVTLKDSKTKKIVYYENNSVKITLNENILCKPTDKGLIKEYNKYKKQVDISKLPDCKTYKISDSSYDGLWETLFVKPLALFIIKVGNLLNNYGLSLIIVGVIIRAILSPFTIKATKQSEQMKKIQPEMEKINKKYENKTDQESLSKKSMEMMALYKKYNVNPLSSCLVAFIQLPILYAFFEAINRVPVIFEEKLFGLVLGTTPMKAITSGHYLYIIIVVLIVLTTIISQKMNKIQAPTQEGVDPNMMMNTLVVMIAVMSLNFSVALSLYWIASTTFTIIQNLLVKKLNGSGDEHANI